MGELVMTISMYQASVPVFVRMLNNLAGILDKAAAHCEAKKIDPSVLIGCRLYPDMFALGKQVRVACDHAKNGVARLAGEDGPAFENDESTFPELVARVRKTIDYLQSVPRERIDGSEEKDVVLQRGDTVNTYKGLDYLINRALPNFYFHVTTAYDILRHNGVELGKRDFLGR
jgi:hypothetical protein